MECCVCSERTDPKKANGIHGRGGTQYYCKKKRCQEQFIEDAGERPYDEEDYAYPNHKEAYARKGEEG